MHPHTTPAGYIRPGFPSLYWPIEADNADKRYLYTVRDAWRFTVMWTLILYAAFHVTSGMCAAVMHRRKVALVFPLMFAVVGGIEAVVAGSVVGALVGAVYHAGYYRMSTWIPCIWGGVNVLVLVLSSFSLQGGL